MTDLIDASTIGFTAGRRILGAACDFAATRDIAVSIAVADRSGHLVAFGRMDGAPLLSERIAQDKAHTVEVFGLPTHDWWNLIKDDPPLLHGIVKTERLVVFGGGVPVVVDGRLVGAVGVSGGTSEQDREIAMAGAGALERQAVTSC